MAIALLHSPAMGKHDLSSLLYSTIGGAAASPELVERFEKALGCKVYGGYGLTETSPAMSMAQIKGHMNEPPETRHVRQATGGCALPGTEIRVVDKDMKDVPCDGVTVGEVITRGDGVMAGYWKQPEATADAFRGGWFHTGDLGVCHPDGYIELKDRSKDIIISGGENISTIEVESVIYRHPAVLECAVVARPDEKWGETPCAFVTLKEGAAASEKDIVDFCRERLAHFKCPKTVIFGALPKTSTGKVQKFVLREKAKAV
jgi:fatty-acyl-CoA synthase